MNNLDDVDVRILRALQRDGTRSSASLAETVGASQASCWRRIKALEERGILGGAVRLLNPKEMGLTVNVFCDIRLHDHEPATYLNFRGFVQSRSEIVECFSMSGEWDYLLRILTRSVEEYENFIMKILFVHPSVKTGSSRFALAMVKYTTALPI
ncbi:Lrp/AsnC family transcriptional regulator [Sphingomonas sp.]|uniref:Lrp/AsnC family transcriptional regulator n=1 Tax=Sphingomonas sp. TaxID=28214 RepID=UPI002DD67809|nr:Lrp/AsnC family transcriptional regulator [Sphingomonas sp.]